MGTRADFYAGKGKDAEWLGSIAWDGDEIAGDIRAAKTEKNYRKAVESFLASRDDATLPAQGWPWPWNDSGTDCSYWFFDGQCWEATVGCPHQHYVPATAKMPGNEAEREAFIAKHERVEFQDMSARKNVVFGGARSGTRVFTAKAESARPLEESQLNRSDLEAFCKMTAIERAALKQSYDVHFANGKEVFVTAKSHEAAWAKASRIVPGVKVRFSQAYLSDLGETVMMRLCKESGLRWKR